LVHQLFRTQAVPVVRAEEAYPRESTRTLQTVEIIQLPLLAVAEGLPDLKVARHPVDAPLPTRVHCHPAPASDLLSLQILAPLEPSGSGDHQARDAGASHTGGRIPRFRRVRPAPVALLVSFPIRAGESPYLRLDRHSSLAGRIEP